MSARSDSFASIMGQKRGTTLEDTEVEISTPSPYKKIENGVTYYYFYEDGPLHREDGPAVEGPHGQDWYLNGELHRLDGPAVTREDGVFNSYFEWWVNGERHRPNGAGPAVIAADGRKEWWVDGKLHRDKGPAYISPDGLEQWWDQGKLHRLDGPAVKHPIGLLEWYKNGLKHREDGPAVYHRVSFFTGRKAWYLHDQKVPPFGKGAKFYLLLQKLHLRPAHFTR